MEQKRVAFHTLGCKLNFSETSTISNLFGENGYQKVDFNEQSDIYVINTCSVTESANKKCKQAVTKAHHIAPDAFIVVIGCFAQLKPKEIVRIPGVNLVLGANEKFNILNYLNALNDKPLAKIHSCEISEVNHFVPSHSYGDRTRSFLKVQDGCDYPCTYCTIPLARGKSRNDSILKTVIEAEKIANKGVKEIVLTGVNIGDFGKSTNEDFLSLIKELDKLEKIERFRISSIEPNLLNKNIIDFVNYSDKFVPHFHIPLQSGSDEILKMMKRRYLTSLFEEKVEYIKSIMPFAAIGADVIVGFPGESENQYIETYQFLNRLDVSYLHVFSYSERPNTEASIMSGKIHKSEIKRRSKMLQILSDKKRRFFYENHLGNSRDVLFEGMKDGDSMFGFTDNYIKVEKPFDKLSINKIERMKLDFVNENGNVQQY